jgi:lambda repressor-like predicted transcriptional regulator
MEGGVSLLSPMTVALAALAIGSAIAVREGIGAWNARSHRLALLACFFVICGEGFGLYCASERLLEARQDHVQSIAQANQQFVVASKRVDLAEKAYERAQALAIAEAKRGGCRQVCRGLREAAEQARVQLEDARSALDHTPPRPESIIAQVTGWRPTVVEIIPALLFTLALNGLGFTLLAIGDTDLGGVNSRVKRSELKTGSGSLRKAKQPRRSRAGSATRGQQVAAFCQKFRQDYGREPTFSEVRDATRFPNSTVSKYRRAALA